MTNDKKQKILRKDKKHDSFMVITLVELDIIRFRFVNLLCNFDMLQKHC